MAKSHTIEAMGLLNRCLRSMNPDHAFLRHRLWDKTLPAPADALAALAVAVPKAGQEKKAKSAASGELRK
jgi:hypothetical protein